MPRRETRESIERALAGRRRKRHALDFATELNIASEVARELERQREKLGFGETVEVHVVLRGGRAELVVRKGRKRRRPRDGSMPAPVEPPRGPRPFQGGAAASLDFGRD